MTGRLDKQMPIDANAPVDHTGAVRPGHRCCGCGYELRGLSIDGACPECGLDIRRSLWFCDPGTCRWVRRACVCWALTAAALGFVTAVSILVENGSWLPKPIESLLAGLWVCAVLLTFPLFLTSQLFWVVSCAPGRQRRKQWPGWMIPLLVIPGLYVAYIVAFFHLSWRSMYYGGAFFPNSVRAPHLSTAMFCVFMAGLMFGYVLGPVLIALHLRRITRRTAMLDGGTHGIAARYGPRLITLGFVILLCSVAALFADAIWELDWFLWVERFPWLMRTVTAGMLLILVGLMLLTLHLTRVVVVLMRPRRPVGRR